MTINDAFLITKQERDRLRKRCDERGLAKVAASLGLTTGSVLRILTEQPVRNGTAMLVKLSLKDEK